MSKSRNFAILRPDLTPSVSKRLIALVHKLFSLPYPFTPVLGPVIFRKLLSKVLFWCESAFLLISQPFIIHFSQFHCISESSELARLTCAPSWMCFILSGTLTAFFQKLVLALPKESQEWKRTPNAEEQTVSTPNARERESEDDHRNGSSCKNDEDFIGRPHLTWMNGYVQGWAKKWS